MVTSDKKDEAIAEGGRAHHDGLPGRCAPLLGGLARARFDFDRYADRAARADTRRLSHDVIHGRDITEPLGLVPAPPERIATVLRSGGPNSFAYFGVNLAGRRLEATDAEVAVGEGHVLRMPAREVLLAVTGRRPG